MAKAVSVCNDEGKIMDLPANRRLYRIEYSDDENLKHTSSADIMDVVHGPFFICRQNDEGEGELIRLTERQAERYRKRFEAIDDQTEDIRNLMTAFYPKYLKE